MALLLPQNPELREMFDVETLAYKRWVSYREAKNSAKEFFNRCKDGSVRSLNYIVLRADDRVQLVTIGPRGGVQVRWNFGKPYGIAA